MTAPHGFTLGFVMVMMTLMLSLIECVAHAAAVIKRRKK